MKVVLKSVCVVLICLVATSCSNQHAVLRKPSIFDGKTYGRLELPPSKKQPFTYNETGKNVELPALEEWADKKAIKKYENSEDFIADNKTTAFLVIRNDSILYEKYFNGSCDTCITQVFSVTKPLIASLLSQALEENRISSLDEKVTNFIPLKRNQKKLELMTLRHLAQMQSGFNQYDYLRLFKIMKLYYAKDVDNFVTTAKVKRVPGTKFKYKSFDTQALGTCLEHIFEEEDLWDRFIKLYWDNIGPEHRGYFSIDDPANNNMKYYGGLNISARDLSKIGRIYLNDGKFDDKQVISEDWIKTIEDTTNRVGKWDYSFGWYFDKHTEENPVYYGSGFTGQFLVINKKNNTIIVRLGDGEGGHAWWELLTDLSTKF